MAMEYAVAVTPPPVSLDVLTRVQMPTLSSGRMVDGHGDHHRLLARRVSEGAMAALPTRERRRARSGLARGDDLLAARQLVPQSVRVRHVPLFVGRQPIRAHAALRELRQLVRKANRG